MMTVLYLTATEKAMYEKLPKSLRDGWSVVNESITTYETAEELHFRYQIAHFEHPSCAAVAKAAKDVQSVKDIERIAATCDVAALSREQLAELFFVLGTKVLSFMILYLLERVKDDQDVEGLAAFTAIRRMLVETNREATPSRS
jgi:hypothetical protein